MAKIDLTSHASSVAIMLVLDVVFLTALIATFVFHGDAELKTVIAAAFSGWNGALALALTGSSKNPSPAETK